MLYLGWLLPIYYTLPMQLALYQPEIPQNTGTLLRLGACLGVAVNIIGPCGFAFSERQLKRAGMDYIDYGEIKYHTSWQTFLSSLTNERLILLSPYGASAYTDFAFQPLDILLVGQESSGVPQEVWAQTHAQIAIPMRPPCRSLNVALAASIVLSEALRQTHLLPPLLS